MVRVGTTRYLILGALVVACALFVAAGAELWSSVSSDVYTRERVTLPKCPWAFASGPDVPSCPTIGENVATGSRPNRLPAAVVFLVGGAAGVVGLVMLRPRPLATLHAPIGSAAN